MTGPAVPGDEELREMWRPVVGYEGLYEVSDRGRARSLHQRYRQVRVLRPWVNHGYLNVSLSEGGRKRNGRVNVLVATAWHGPCPAGYVCRHLDGDPVNNNLANLAWGRPSENAQDTIRHGRHRLVNRSACQADHEYTEENTLWKSNPRNGHRVRLCRTCHHAATARYRARRALAAREATT